MLQKFIEKIVLKNNVSQIIFSIIFDSIGLLSFSIPFFGEFSDVIWAPIAAYLMSKIYPNRTGKIVSVFVFVEELLPFVDVIPTFTIMSIYIILKEKRKVNS